MADVIIRALKNGPYEVAGGVKLFDHQGKEHQEDQIDPSDLCRCGQSKNKSFCDGSHEGASFQAAETAGECPVSSSDFPVSTFTFSELVDQKREIRH
jgi:CDGSH-type Zn-finger protein